MTANHNGTGYRLAAYDGGIFTFGAVNFCGSEGGQPLNAPVVGMTTTGDNGGYWEVARDGGIFTFGDAQFYGSRGEGFPRPVSTSPVRSEQPEGRVSRSGTASGAPSTSHADSRQFLLWDVFQVADVVTSPTSTAVRRVLARRTPSSLAASRSLVTRRRAPPNFRHWIARVVCAHVRQVVTPLSKDISLRCSGLMRPTQVKDRPVGCQCRRDAHRRKHQRNSCFLAHLRPPAQLRRRCTLWMSTPRRSSAVAYECLQRWGKWRPATPAPAPASRTRASTGSGPNRPT